MDLVIPCYAFERATAGSPELMERNGHKVVAFDAATVETLEFQRRMPSAYLTGSNLTVTVTMFAASATSGTVRVRLEWEYIAPGTFDIDADSFDTAVEVNATADSNSGDSFAAVFTLANSDIDDQAAGGMFRLRLSRVGNDGTNDTMTGDAQFRDVVLSQ